MGGRGIAVEKGLYSHNKCVARADVVNLETGEIWEIKTARSGRRASWKQVGRYINAGLTIDSAGNTPAIIGQRGQPPVGKFNGVIPLMCMGYTYHIYYWTPEPGVIVYKVTPARLTQEEFARAYEYIPKMATKREPNPALVYAFDTNPSIDWGGLVFYGVLAVVCTAAIYYCPPAAVKILVAA